MSNLVAYNKLDHIYSILVDISKSPKIVNLIANLNNANDDPNGIMARINNNCDSYGESALLRVVSRFVKFMAKHDG